MFSILHKAALEWRVESGEWRFNLLVMVDRLEVFFPVRVESFD